MLVFHYPHIATDNYQTIIIELAKILKEWSANMATNDGIDVV